MKPKRLKTVSQILLSALLLCGVLWLILQSTPSSNPINGFVAHVKRLFYWQVAMAQSRNDWRTPIAFYGKVVDENNRPVKDVVIHFSCNDLSINGTSFYRAVSDANGLFSLKGKRGKHLSLKVEKDGYYTSARDNNNFTYAGENVNFVPNVKNPILFHLRKKGAADPLLFLDKRLRISITGNSLGFDLRTAKAVPPEQADIVMEFVKSTSDKLKYRNYAWHFKLGVPNGGLILSTNEFDFTAPENGYASSDLVEVPSTLTDGDWQGELNRSYFVKLHDGSYARITLDLMSYNGSLRIRSLLNPSGSRNLEFDPKKMIQPSE